jgi:hypothetical protein
MSIKPKLIAVVGASGRQGSSVVKSLLQFPDQWRVRGTTDNLNLPLCQVRIEIERESSIPKFVCFYVQEFTQHGVDMVECNINN